MLPSRSRKELFLALAFGFLLCCVTIAQTFRTNYDYALGVDFSKYHTYRWVAIKGQYFDSSLDAQIKQSIDTQLAAQGFTKEGAAADLGVDYQTAIQEIETWQVYEDWTDTGLISGRLPKRKKVVIQKGTLVIDMYDAAAKRLIWTGRADRVLDVNNSPEDRRRNLDKAARQLLSTFPPTR